MASQPGKASIVILTYNNLEDTRVCLDSIFSKTESPEYEVIVVDNASTDGTQDYLVKLASEKKNLRIQLNKHNEGFARGNNIGVALAEGEYLVFLNNDTAVTKGWLAGLIRHLADEEIGMVGPVTNSASNQSRIPVDYSDLADMDAFAAQYTRAHEGQAFDIPVLAFMCVAMRRALFEEIGPLDELFGLGMFEDDDYAMRVRRKGCRIICAEDVFIHHSGGRSFLKLDAAQYWRLFWENRGKFERKWDVRWTPHISRPELLPDHLIEVSEFAYGVKLQLVEAEERLRAMHIEAEYYKRRNHELLRAEYELGLILQSRSWKMITYIRQAREKLIPVRSRREKLFLTGLGKTMEAARSMRQLGRGKSPAQAVNQPVPAEQAALPIPQKKAGSSLPARRIAILTPQFYDFQGETIYIGGAERYLVELVRLVGEMGYEPVVYQGAAGSWVRYYADFTIIGLDTKGDPANLNQVFHKVIDPDMPVIYLAFFLAAPHCARKSIGVSHGVYWDVGNDVPLHAQVYHLEQILNPIQNLRSIVSVDTNTINWVRGINTTLGHKFSYIPNFVDLEQFKPAGRKETDRIVILYPRRLYPPRGFWLVKELVPEFVTRYPQVDFYFVGQANQDEEAAMAELMQAYPGRIRWETMAFDDMYKAYLQADITLIPTVHSEGTSLSCLEAMASGNAIIATNVGGLPDLVISGFNGMLIEPDIPSLAEALHLLVQNAPLRAVLAANAVAVARTFDLEQWRDKWRKAIEAALTLPHPPGGSN